ncbi:hypothetical protein [Pedobacter cryotolerans]|uniref:Outer membrane lipoprotein carrier protein LolA n=1 Tax=Pedobacter cryotolerans TaxID=2571270 RepID=A0A4V5NXA6_9SPHI|nr:hypothetical protein [Pedobacter cryotolerans]TKB98443.1 hypothetical protein FA045_14075 [Pedobacter cryotolerans]
MHKVSFSVLLCLAASLSSFAQKDWSAIESDLYRQMTDKKITTEEWSFRLRKDAGYFDRLSLWVEDESEISDKSTEKIKLYFPADFKVVMPNGNTFAKAYLLNNTADSIEIARIDATLANVQEYYFIKNKWVAFRTNGTSTCGNSYFSNKLPPNRQLTLELTNDILTDGTKKIPYKISIVIGSQQIESNVITVKLHDTQLKRMMEGVSKLNNKL